jgi:hypothetical protein
MNMLRKKSGKQFHSQYYEKGLGIKLTRKQKTLIMKIAEPQRKKWKKILSME